MRTVLADPDLNVRFVIQCPPPASVNHNGDGLPEGLAELKRLEQEAVGRVTLVPERLDEANYSELLRCLDVVLIPYQPEGYVEPTSGIFTEALAAAKPVVVPKGTWMARELAASGGGVEFEPGDADDLACKTIEVVRRYPEYLARAARGRAVARLPQRRSARGHLADRSPIVFFLASCRLNIPRERP